MPGVAAQRNAPTASEAELLADGSPSCLLAGLANSELPHRARSL
jgi:hypothetical protein